MEHGLGLTKHAFRLFMAFAAALGIVLGSSSLAFADEARNEVGAIIAVTDAETGALEFTIEKAAGEDGAFGAVRLSNGYSYTGESLELGSVYQEIDGKRYGYYVTGVGAYAFTEESTSMSHSMSPAGNTSLKRVVFNSDLTAGTPAVGDYAFYNCTALETVEFPSHVAGIGRSAFQNCTALTNVVFPPGSELYVTSTLSVAAVGESAFEGCSSLVSITLPAIMSATRFGDAYFSFSEYNPGTNQSLGVDNLSLRYCSGHQSWWHNGGGPVCRPGLGGYAFKDCSNLRTVIYEAGNPTGAYSYFWLSGKEFDGCTSLNAFVFESSQAYAVDPNGSMHNSSPVNIFANSARPSLYYAVDYYATDGEPSDDARGSTRLSRVEYERGTPISAIATSNAAELADWAYEVSAYAQSGYADGFAPDPHEAAINAGLDPEKDWVWKLTGSQSRRTGLTESCKAYLVEKTDISAGRIESSAISAMYDSCDENYSRGFVQDTTFDPARYYDPRHQYTIGEGDNYTVGLRDDRQWFVLDSAIEESFLAKFVVVSVDGTALTPDSFVISFQSYDAESKSLAAATLGSADGPLLMTVTPSAESGYTGVLQEWVLVKGHAGSVRECYTEEASATWRSAIYHASLNGLADIRFDGPYAVGIGSADAAGALVAAGYAGLTNAPISTINTDSEEFGFTVATEFFPDGAISGGEVNYGRGRYGALDVWSAVAFREFESRRAGIGLTADEYPWGSVAVLVSPDSINEVAAAAAAYAYAMKAPVFFTGSDGVLGEGVLGCLKQFDSVVVIGDETCLSGESLEAIRSKLPDAEIERIRGDERSAASHSLAVAQRLIDDGLATPAAVAIADAANPVDAISALNFSGTQGGITLATSSTANAKVAAAYLTDNRDSVNTVRLFGRDGGGLSGDAFNLYESLCCIWTGGYESPTVGAGDTLTLSGAQFAIGVDGVTLTFSEQLWPHGEIPSGTYAYDGSEYVLHDAVEAYGVEVRPDEQKGDEQNEGPASADGLKKPSVVWAGPFTPTNELSWLPDATANNSAAPNTRGQDSASGRGATPGGSAVGGATAGNTSSGINVGSSTGDASVGAGSAWLSTGTNAASPGSGGQLTVSNASLGGTLNTGTGSTSGRSGATLNLALDTSESSSENAGGQGARSSAGNAESNGSGNNAGSGDGGGSSMNGGITPNNSARSETGGSSDGADIARTPDSANQGQSSAPIAGIIVAAIVAAIGAALGFAWRRRSGSEGDFEE